jgi:hypothetical protein
VVPAVADFAQYLPEFQATEKEEDATLEDCSPISGGSEVRPVNSSAFDFFHEKEGDAWPKDMVSAGGGSGVRLVNPSIPKTILASSSFECKLSGETYFNRATAKKAIAQVKDLKILPSSKLGVIKFNWGYLSRHFRQKAFREFILRVSLAPAVVETLRQTEQFYSSHQYPDRVITYGRYRQMIFAIVLEKFQDTWRVKTFFLSRRLTNIWKQLEQKYPLPLELPHVQSYEPTDTGDSPLAKITDWVETECPACGGKAQRETDTMPNWAGSSWYFLRYLDPQNPKHLAAPEKLNHWTPVDLYNGGMEHTVLHLLYSRFWHKFLFDLGCVPTPEPYAKRISHGMILGPDGEKMSKSRGNVINPDEIVAQYGADTLRVYEMFIGPFDQAAPWSLSGVEGVKRFLEKAWRLFTEKKLELKPADGCPVSANPEFRRALNRTIKKVTEDIDSQNFNTAVSSMMIFVNFASAQAVLPQPGLEKFLKILSPFAPHLAEELWEKLGHNTSILREPWPEFNPQWIEDETVNLVIQINGKLRDTISVPKDIAKDDALKLAKSAEKITKWLEGKKIVKEIFVQGKLVNLVVQE